MIRFSKITLVTFNKFFYRYRQRIEERVLCDVNDYIGPLDEMQDVFGLLVQMKVDPVKFIDYVFNNSTHLPTAKTLMAFLKNYDDRVDMKYVPTLFERIDAEIGRVCEVRSLYYDMMDLYVYEKTIPFLPIFDHRIEHCLWNNKFPPFYDGAYIEKLFCAYYVMDEYQALKEKLKTEWVPILKKIG